MLNKFLLSGLLLTGSLAILSPANAMNEDAREEEGSKTPVKFEDGAVTIPYGTSAKVTLTIKKNEHNNISAEELIPFDPTQNYLLSGSMRIANSMTDIQSSASTIKMNDEIEKNSSSVSPKISDLETVKLDNGCLSLTGEQLLECRFIDILETQIGRFSVSPGVLPKNTNLVGWAMIGPDCNDQEFHSVESDGKFEFSFNTLQPLPGEEFMLVPWPQVIFLKKI